MLSNTATPKYYGMFRNAVLSGKLPVCENIAKEMRRIDNLIKSPGVYYDDEATDRWIDFCEGELVLTNGEPLKMLDSFKLWGEQIYGWYYFEDRSIYIEGPHGGRFERIKKKKRLINKQYLILGRGGAKTIYDSCHQGYILIVDPSTTEQVTVAPTMALAEEVITPLKTSIVRSHGDLFKFLTAGSIQNTTGNRANRPKLASTKKGIEFFLTNSLLEIRPMSIDKLQGRKDKIATVDEWLSGDTREDPLTALEQGCAKNDDWLIILTSSEGTVRNGIGDTIKMELMDILEGRYTAPNVSIWWYRLDDINEVSNPSVWVKANPNIGKTVSYEAYQMEVERAQHVPSARNDIIAKRFGIPMEGYTYFFSYPETIPHRHREYWRMLCSMGVDLSQGDDFCAFTFLFPLTNGQFGIKTRSYITERTLMGLQPAMRQEYNKFLEEGSLIVMPGTVLQMMQIYDDIYQLINQREYQVCAVGYDPYFAKEFIERWCQENTPYGVEKVPQGVRTESVPLGELKKLSEDRKLLFDEELMKFAMGNCIAIEDTNGNRKLYKKRSNEKIDNVAAMLDAYIAYKVNIQLFE